MSGQELPPALAPWAATLAAFPRDLALTLGPWLARLSGALGPLSRHRACGSGEPDGLDGLARRGSYERLLASEWLLADEAPLEFARRAAAGEHGFLALARKQAAGARRCVALLDVGPDQLGAPRLAHLALLLVLKRRAAEAGADLAFGALQRPEGPLHEGLTPGAVTAWLAARDWSGPTAAHLGAWSERLGTTADERWIVGGRAAAGLDPEWSRVLVDEEPPCLEVRVRRRAGGERTLTLDLPPEPVGVRLLRQPFAPPAATPVTMGPPPRMLAFSSDGRRLIGRMADGSFLAWHVPHSARATEGRSRVWRVGKGQGVVGAGWFGRGWRLLTTDGDRLRYWHGGDLRAMGPALAGPASEGIPPMFGIPPTGRIRLVVIDGEGTLRVLAIKDGGFVGEFGRRGVRGACAVGDNRVAYVVAHAEFAEIAVWPEDRPSKVVGVPCAAPPAAFFGWSTQAYARTVAIEKRPGVWAAFRDHRSGESYEWAAPAGDEVVGVTADRRTGEAVLVVRAADGRRLRLVGRSLDAALPSAGTSPIVAAVASGAAAHVAWLRADGRATVYDLMREEVLLEVQPGATP